MRSVLPASFYARPSAEVARALLGTLLRATVGGTECLARIVETEAYTGPDDEASHAAMRIGRTVRNEPMYGLPGIAYVYRIYGIHWCLNAVTDTLGHPAAVLIRAAEPVSGIETMRVRRAGRPDRELLRGPGNLCSALGITGVLNRHPMTTPPLEILDGAPVAGAGVALGPRVGVTRAADLPLRFWIRGNPHVSRTP